MLTKNLLRLNTNFVRFYLPRFYSLKMSKFDSKEFNALLTPTVRKIQNVFEDNNFEIRLCGGVVRDLLQGKQPKDIDFATTALPEEMLDLCSEHKWRTINTNGLSHGTVTIRLDEENFEITTLRIDKVTDGRKAEVEFTKDWQQDAERRDLTFNSLFLGLDGTLYDYFNGAEDLKLKRVRFVGDAEKRIQEDYLRILRYFRFFGRIDPPEDGHDSETLEIIRTNAHGLQRISGERIWVELKLILLGNQAPQLMHEMFKVGLFKYFAIPNRQPKPDFDSAYQKSRILKPVPITVLSSLFESEAEVKKFESRIKFSRLERLIALFIVQHKNQSEQSNFDLYYYQDILVDNKDFPPKSHPLFEYLKYTGNKEIIEALENWEVPKFPISGHELKNYNVKPGKDAGRILKLLREKWKQSRFLTSKDELLQSVPNMLS